jgi:hypothetical protein
MRCRLSHRGRARRARLPTGRRTREIVVHRPDTGIVLGLQPNPFPHRVIMVSSAEPAPEVEMDQQHDRRRRTLVVVAAVAIFTLAAGGTVALKSVGGGDGRTSDDHGTAAAPAPGWHVGSAVREDAKDFVADLRAGNRTAALAHGTGAVYDLLVRDEGDSTTRVRLQRCARSADEAAWTCGLDFPSTGPGDGEAFAMTMTRSGPHWMATSAAVVAG